MTHGLGFNGSSFKWSNERIENVNIQARPGREFDNHSWRFLFQNVLLTHLPAIQSDHEPLLLKLKGNLAFRPRPFLFKGMWTLEQFYINVIQETWNAPTHGSPLFQIVCSLKNTKVSLKKLESDCVW